MPSHKVDAANKLLAFKKLYRQDAAMQYANHQIEQAAGVKAIDLKLNVDDEKAKSKLAVAQFP